MYSKFLHILSMVAADQTNVAHQCLISPRLCLFPPLAAPPSSHIQNKVIPGGIGIEMLFPLSNAVFIFTVFKFFLHFDACFLLDLNEI